MIFEVIVAAIVVLIVLNSWATWRVVGDDLSSWKQRLGQIAFVWLVPILGAFLTLTLKRSEPERGSGTYLIEHPPPDDFGYSRQRDRDHRSTEETTTGHHGGDAPPE